jgi:fatty acid desaturase
MGPPCTKQITTTDSATTTLLLQELCFLREPKDVFLLLVFLANGLLYGTFFWQFEHLTGTARSVLGLVLSLLICTNYQCVAHNFIHNPFFVDNDKKNDQHGVGAGHGRLLNTLFSLLNSPLLGMPQSMYTVHHLLHHRYNNDYRDPKTQTTKDATSLYRHASRHNSNNNNRPENLLSYCLLGVLRTELGEMYRLANSQPKWAIHVEIMLCVVPFPLAYCLGGTSLLLAYTLVWYAGQALALAENYFEHYGATPGNRQTDSVSCYNPIYNALWFNNGYHQEHHYKPTVHWTRIPSVREQLPTPLPASSSVCPTNNNGSNIVGGGRRVVPFAHFTTMFFPLPTATAAVTVPNSKNN